MTSFSLKIIALITMIIDHIGSVFFEDVLIFRYIGRIAFPIYAFFISEGCRHTKNFKRYLYRLFIFAAICEPLYDLTFNSNINFLKNTNTIFTLFFASLIIYILINVKTSIKYLLTIWVLFIVKFLETDYEIWGISLILIFYFFSSNLKFVFSSLFILLKDINLFLYYLANGTFYIPLIIFNISTFISLFFIYMYNGEKGRSIKYFFYVAYPLHFFIILLVKFILYNTNIWRNF